MLFKLFFIFTQQDHLQRTAAQPPSPPNLTKKQKHAKLVTNISYDASETIGQGWNHFYSFFHFKVFFKKILSAFPLMSLLFIHSFVHLCV